MMENPPVFDRNGPLEPNTPFPLERTTLSLFRIRMFGYNWTDFRRYLDKIG